MHEYQYILFRLAVALAIGLLIGVERGWKERGAEEGSRVAGIRTYGLIGLLGGVAAVAGERTGALLPGLVFLGLACVLTSAYIVNLRRTDDAGITSLVAGLLVFILGVLAGVGHTTEAAAAAVVTTLLLGYKQLLHHLVGALELEELHAGLKLLLISVVLLPILPDHGYGPWQALNPYEIWWMVVLIAGVSFTGYVAMKVGGPEKGAMFTGLFAGFASSTALTLHFSRLARSQRSMAPALATGILLACGTMSLRMLVVAGAFNWRLVPPMLGPALVMAVAAYLPVVFYWFSPERESAQALAPLRNPLELRSALAFGALLAVVMFLAKALQAWFGEVGVLGLAGVSGIADVDAITLSLARMNLQDLALHVAVTGAVLAAAVNSVVKGGMAAVIGGRSVGLRVGVPLLASAGAGLLSVWLLVWRS